MATFPIIFNLGILAKWASADSSGHYVDKRGNVRASETCWTIQPIATLLVGDNPLSLRTTILRLAGSLLQHPVADDQVILMSVQPLVSSNMQMGMLCMQKRAYLFKEYSLGAGLPHDRSITKPQSSVGRAATPAAPKGEGNQQCATPFWEGTIIKQQYDDYENAEVEYAASLNR